MGQGPLGVGGGLRSSFSVHHLTCCQGFLPNPNLAFVLPQSFTLQAAFRSVFSLSPQSCLPPNPKAAVPCPSPMLVTVQGMSPTVLNTVLGWLMLVLPVQEPQVSCGHVEGSPRGHPHLPSFCSPQERQEKALGILTYLGQSAAEAQTQPPWYQLPPGRGAPQPGPGPDEKIKNRLDPLREMEKHLRRKRRHSGEDGGHKMKGKRMPEKQQPEG